jgi:hypothetical protein
MTRAIGRADERSVSRLPGARRISVRVAAKLLGSTAAAAGAAARTEERINLLEDAEREDTGGDPSNTLTDGERFRMYGRRIARTSHSDRRDAQTCTKTNNQPSIVGDANVTAPPRLDERDI